jgi:hypothetical protein
VLECAVAAGSRYIVTGDADLLRLRRYGSIQIMRVPDFMALMVSGSSPARYDCEDRCRKGPTPALDRAIPEEGCAFSIRHVQDGSPRGSGGGWRRRAGRSRATSPAVCLARRARAMSLRP